LDLAGAEVEVARMDNHLTRLREVLGVLTTDAAFDFVILDCPPSLGILMTNALAAADELLVPIQCEYLALEGVSKIVGLVEQIKASGANPDLAISGFVMTMFDQRTNLSQQVVAEVRKHFAPLIFQTLIPRSVRLGEAPSFGKTILEYDPNGVAAQAYKKLANEFLRRQGVKIDEQPASETEQPPPAETPLMEDNDRPSGLAPLLEHPLSPMLQAARRGV